MNKHVHAMVVCNPTTKAPSVPCGDNVRQCVGCGQSVWLSSLTGADAAEWAVEIRCVCLACYLSGKVPAPDIEAIAVGKRTARGVAETLEHERQSKVN